ncbi:hypothetical protein AGABI1DRAFT_83074 [Agaricus bisporus var. burnettii JB137-S8]|nr:uncharacterized protein AGABI1DRAFT_83074 [Agaricus bisporus var. burnettii JB137-S8]EKM81594.1 hypothetical protein AGABI1DRAFT_83074 [Agaricus bisporus var. burnettii JB137-S8]
MNVLTFFFTVFTILGSFVVEAVPTAQPEKRDVFVPRITSPVAGDVWNSNQQAQVTWDTSDAPENITNSKGVVVLRRGDLATPVVLAGGFNILDGSVSFDVPLVFSGDDYSITLFGDSGNFSPTFTINGFSF